MYCDKKKRIASGAVWGVEESVFNIDVIITVIVIFVISSTEKCSKSIARCPPHTPLCRPFHLALLFPTLLLTASPLQLKLQLLLPLL